MDLQSFSWLLMPLAALAAIILLLRVLLPVTALSALVLVKRYFRCLIPVPNDSLDEISEYVAEARVLALGAGFEFVDRYRPFRGPWMDRRTDVWRAADFKTIALISEGETPGTYTEITLYSTLDTGRRLTTTDNAGAGDPRGLRGVLARPGASFRELYRIHRARMKAHQAEPTTMGASDPVAVIEDLDRAHVEDLVDAGLARYRNDRRTSWSYTWKGGFEVYYLAQPKIIRTVRGGVQAPSGPTAD